MTDLSVSTAINRTLIYQRGIHHGSQNCTDARDCTAFVIAGPYRRLRELDWTSNRTWAPSAIAPPGAPRARQRRAPGVLEERSEADHPRSPRTACHRG
ncbi:Hypothetical protein NTJ_13769 [Nesidiocoris tenuis]|nr:Hypothetical protein NTJ_13769 [Nesidiocoris tenuis]